MTDLIISIVIAVLIVAGVIYTRNHFKRRSGCCGGGGEYISKKKLKNIVAKKLFVVDGMTCEKCKARIERYQWCCSHSKCKEKRSYCFNVKTVF